jgi:hypothetical protein
MSNDTPNTAPNAAQPGEWWHLSVPVKRAPKSKALLRIELRQIKRAGLYQSVHTTTKEGDTVSSNRGVTTLVQQHQVAATLRDVVESQKMLSAAMKKVMREGVHYGKIPGTPKPTLYKPGAEVLCAMFHIATTYEATDLSGTLEDGVPFVRYRVVCRGSYQPNAMHMGEGLGECSSLEDKYAWRRAKPGEFDEADEWQRREAFVKDGRLQQVRTNPHDQGNTVLKMACKRAHVAMTLSVVAASDVFTQDLEDDPDAIDAGAPRGKPATDKPRAASGQRQSGVINEGQLKLLRSKMEGKSVDSVILCDHFGINKLEELPFDKLNEAIKFIDDNA